MHRPPFWQIVVSLALMLATTIAAVWAAGKRSPVNVDRTTNVSPLR